MFRWFSQDTEEIAEFLVNMVLACFIVLKNNGWESLGDGLESGVNVVKSFSRRSRIGVEEYHFMFDGKFQEFETRIEDRRKSGAGVDLCIEGDARYYGFKLYCDLLTGRVTVDASDSILVSVIGNKSTRKAHKLCRVFSRKYAKLTSGRIERSAF